MIVEVQKNDGTFGKAVNLAKEAGVLRGLQSELMICQLMGRSGSSRLSKNNTLLTWSSSGTVEEVREIVGHQIRQQRVRACPG